MRTGLQALYGKRTTFIATFSRRDVFRTKWGWMEKVLLKNIFDVQHKPLANHTSITDRPSLQRLSFLKDGDLIVFSARVIEYIRGYFGNDIDLRSQHPYSVDYMLFDVRDVKKQNIDLPKNKIMRDLGFDRLMKNRHISLGVVA
jgi:hypothetical protein